MKGLFCWVMKTGLLLLNFYEVLFPLETGPFFMRAVAHLGHTRGAEPNERMNDGAD